MDPTDWLDRYAGAWMERDPNAASSLFTEDAWYRRDIFGEPFEGRDGVHSYWLTATAAQSDVHVLIGEPLIVGDTVVAEWWTTMISDGTSETVPGVLVLGFAPDGLCRQLREYAHFGEPREPYEGWGEMADCDEDSTLRWAQNWATTWERCWRAMEVDPILELYSDAGLYRSHPFREPHRGRAGVRDYVSGAFDEEEDPKPRFAVVGAQGAVAAVEYWAPMIELKKAVTIAGCVLVTFDEQGLVRNHRECWEMKDGTYEPPPEWGR